MSLNKGMLEYSGAAKKGIGLASKLGFPTANLPLPGDLPSGIYAAEVILKGRKYASAVYADRKRKLLEAHLLDFYGDLQGEALEVRVIKKIRNSRKFKDDEALRAAIASDISKVRELFEDNHS